jgi:hypothetical protein
MWSVRGGAVRGDLRPGCRRDRALASSPAVMTTRRRGEKTGRGRRPGRPAGLDRSSVARSGDRPGHEATVAYATFAKDARRQPLKPRFRASEELREAQLVHARGDGEGRLELRLQLAEAQRRLDRDRPLSRLAT